MGKQTVEIELLDSRRDEPRVQQPSSPWPFEVVDPRKCEFQYRAFRSAYDRLQRDGEGNPWVNNLTDAELRVRWLDFYVCFKEPSLAQIDAMARKAAGRYAPSSMTPDMQRGLLLMGVAALLIFMLLTR